VRATSRTTTDIASKSTESRARQRDLNTRAARRYRQRRTDETQNLEAELEETRSERDALKIQVARLEGEVEGLRQRLPG